MRYNEFDAKMTPTGRTPSEPEIQNLPGTPASILARKSAQGGRLFTVTDIMREVRRMTETNKALANFLEARRAAKPCITVKASGFCTIRGRGFETYGFSPDDALRRWHFGVGA